MSLKSLTTRHTLTRKSRATTIGESGSAAHSWSGTDKIQGRLQPASAEEMMYGLQRGYDITHTLYCSTNPGVSNGDVLDFEGREMHVRGPARNIDELGRLWVVQLEEKQQRQDA